MTTPVARAHPFLAPTTRPLVVGHRGVPTLHQENTLAGFRRAIELGVPAIELDVRLTKDRRAVVMHDGDVERLTGTVGTVAEMTWDELSKLRVRRELPMGIDVRGGFVVARYDRTEPLTLLEEVLAEIAPKILINIELKFDLPVWWPTEVGRVVARDIARAGVVDRVIVSSFDVRKLRAAQQELPDVVSAFAFDDTMLSGIDRVLDRLPAIPAELGPGDDRPHPNSRRLLNRILESRVAKRLLKMPALAADHTLIGHDTVQRVHALGLAIGTHTLLPIGSSTGKHLSPTAASEDEVRRLIDLGVEWIETDDPVRVLELAARHRR